MAIRDNTPHDRLRALPRRGRHNEPPRLLAFQSSRFLARWTSAPQSWTFAAGGAIRREALRVGDDVFASDMNPVTMLLKKVALESIPKYGQRVSDEREQRLKELFVGWGWMAV